MMMMIMAMVMMKQFFLIRIYMTAAAIIIRDNETQNETCRRKIRQTILCMIQIRICNHHHHFFYCYNSLVLIIYSIWNTQTKFKRFFLFCVNQIMKMIIGVDDDDDDNVNYSNQQRSNSESEKRIFSAYIRLNIEYYNICTN